MKTRKQKSLIYENKGVALVSVMIAVAFISILASALLYITCRNYQMKVMNLNSKDNFYETNGELTKVLTTLRNDVITSANPNAKMANYYAAALVDSLTEAGVKTGTYNVLEVVKLAHADATGDEKNAHFTLGGTDGDNFYFHSDTNTVKVSKDPANTNVTIYKLADLEVMQKSKDGYENRVKTDITIKVQEIKGNASAIGGVGDFSMILDSSLDASASNFSALAIYGNSYVSSYGDGRTVLSDGKTYVDPGKYEEGKAALNLSGQAKISILGDYMVVYGDIVLGDHSCLQINEGTKLTVYGDIIVKDSATFICNGELFMYDGLLPGRADVSNIKVLSGTKQEHVFPAALEPSRSDLESYQNFCDTIHLSDTNAGNLGSDNIGLISKIMDSFEYNSSDYSGTMAFNDIQGKSPHQGETTTATFYGQNCGVKFNKDTSPNGSLKNYLVMDMTGNVTMKETNTNTTFISKAPIKIQELHDIMFTKIGGNLFKYLSIDSDDTSNPYYNASIHSFDFKVDSGFGNSPAQISVGDFFDDNCDNTVKNMLNYSTGGAGGGVSTYYSSMQFEEFSKDWN